MEDWEMKKKLKVFLTPWHIAHQYRLLKALENHCEFYFLINSVRRWNKHIRPVPNNASFVPYYEKGKYDLAILNVDQQCVDPEIGKSQLYRALNQEIQDIPKIVINHGTPTWPENKYGWDEEEIIERMRLMIGNNTMIANSHKAVEQWGIGKAIWHGMEPSDWWDLPKEPRIVTMVSPAGMDRYYNRRLLSAIKQELINTFKMSLIQITVDWSSEEQFFRSQKTNDFTSTWDSYRDFLGRSLVYINCTYDSPMPSARTEAMLSGCCVLTSKYQDADMFFKNGDNGFILPDNPQQYAELAYELCNNFPEKAIEIGQAGKQTAIKEFGMDRYREDWLKIIGEVL